MAFSEHQIKEILEQIEEDMRKAKKDDNLNFDLTVYKDGCWDMIVRKVDDDGYPL